MKNRIKMIGVAIIFLCYLVIEAALIMTIASPIISFVLFGQPLLVTMIRVRLWKPKYRIDLVYRTYTAHFETAVPILLGTGDSESDVRKTIGY